MEEEEVEGKEGKRGWEGRKIFPVVNVGDES